MMAKMLHYGQLLAHLDMQESTVKDAQLDFIAQTFSPMNVNLVKTNLKVITQFTKLMEKISSKLMLVVQ
jgi:hypothetical protein